MRGDAETRDNLSRGFLIFQVDRMPNLFCLLLVSMFLKRSLTCCNCSIAGTDLNNLEVLIADDEILEISGKSSFEFVDDSESFPGVSFWAV